MNNIRVSITMTHPRASIMREIQEVIGYQGFYQGTDDRLFIDMWRREAADLAVANLNLIPGVKAEILERVHA